VPETDDLVVAGGKRLEARWVGPPRGAAPATIFLHEGLGSVSQWRDFPDLAAAATGSPTLVYSRAGHGRSDPAPPPWPLDFMTREASVLFEVMDAAGLAEATLVGHSDGASIALLAAAAAPTRVRRLVLLAPHVFCEPVTRQGIAAAVAGYSGLAPRLARHHGDQTDDTFRAWSGVWLDARFAAWNIEAALGAVRAPALVIQGDRDAYGTLAQVEAIAAGSGGPVRRLILPGCGHAPQRDRPDATLAALVTFVAG
jgi:pimeloyl-ACP methyl ester carboxylesterase